MTPLDKQLNLPFKLYVRFAWWKETVLPSKRKLQCDKTSSYDTSDIQNYFTVQNKPGIISRVVNAFSEHKLDAKKRTVGDWKVVRKKKDGNSSSPERINCNSKNKFNF